jgi:hypothetical protein
MAKISKDYIDNYGNTPTSPWMGGEQANRTPASVHGSARKTDIEGPGERTWDEPDVVAPSRSMNTVVFQAKNGGNSVVVNDEGSDGDGYMLITHNSGTVVQIDHHGTVLIKSFGDTYNVTEGLHYQRSEGSTNLNVGEDWNVRVEGGSNNVYVQGDVNIECENYNLEVRGKATINAAEALELRGAKVSIEASVTDIDFAAAQNVRGTAVGGYLSLGSKGDMILSSMGIANYYGDSEMRITSGGNGYLSFGDDSDFKVKGEWNMQSTGVAYLDGNEVRLGEGSASPEAAKQPQNAQMPELKTPEARRPSSNSDANINKVTPSPLSISDRSTDDAE